MYVNPWCDHYKHKLQLELTRSQTDERNTVLSVLRRLETESVRHVKVNQTLQMVGEEEEEG